METTCFFNNIKLPANATYSLGRIGNQYTHLRKPYIVLCYRKHLQLHLIVTINGPLPPNSTVGMYVFYYGEAIHQSKNWEYMVVKPREW